MRFQQDQSYMLENKSMLGKVSGYNLYYSLTHTVKLFLISAIPFQSSLEKGKGLEIP
jgi:hypothetical protein